MPVWLCSSCATVAALLAWPLWCLVRERLSTPSPCHPCIPPLPSPGLTAFGRRGQLIAGGTLPMEVVRAAWEFAATHDVPVCGFLEEECVTHKMHPELEELHHRWVLGGWVGAECMQAGWPGPGAGQAGAGRTAFATTAACRQASRIRTLPAMCHQILLACANELAISTPAGTTSRWRRSARLTRCCRGLRYASCSS